MKAWRPFPTESGTIGAENEKGERVYGEDAQRALQSQDAAETEADLLDQERGAAAAAAPGIESGDDINVLQGAMDEQEAARRQVQEDDGLTGPGAETITEPTQDEQDVGSRLWSVVSESSSESTDEAIRNTVEALRNMDQNVPAATNPTELEGVAQYLLDNPDSDAWQGLRKSKLISGIRTISKADDGPRLIYGPASVSVVDTEGDLITGEALKGALPHFLKRSNISLSHMDIQAGQWLERAEVDGREYVTEVRPITKEDIEEFPVLKENDVEVGTDAMFVVAEIFKDTTYCNDVWDEIQKGNIGCFSISGQSVKESKENKCEGFQCKLVNVIEELSGSALTLCEAGMNASAVFRPLTKSESTPHFSISMKEDKVCVCDDDGQCECGASAEDVEITEAEDDAEIVEKACDCGGDCCSADEESEGRGEMPSPIVPRAPEPDPLEEDLELIIVAEEDAMMKRLDSPLDDILGKLWRPFNTQSGTIGAVDEHGNKKYGAEAQRLLSGSRAAEAGELGARYTPVESSDSYGEAGYAAAGRAADRAERQELLDTVDETDPSTWGGPEHSATHRAGYMLDDVLAGAPDDEVDDGVPDVVEPDADDTREFQHGATSADDASGGDLADEIDDMWFSEVTEAVESYEESGPPPGMSIADAVELDLQQSYMSDKKLNQDQKDFINEQYEKLTGRPSSGDGDGLYGTPLDKSLDTILKDWRPEGGEERGLPMGPGAKAVHGPTVHVAPSDEGALDLPEKRPQDLTDAERNSAATNPEYPKGRDQLEVLDGAVGQNVSREEPKDYDGWVQRSLDPILKDQAHVEVVEEAMPEGPEVEVEDEESYGLSEVIRDLEEAQDLMIAALGEGDMEAVEDQAELVAHHAEDAQEMEDVGIEDDPLGAGGGDLGELEIGDMPDLEFDDGLDEEVGPDDHAEEVEEVIGDGLVEKPVPADEDPYPVREASMKAYRRAGHSEPFARVVAYFIDKGYDGQNAHLLAHAAAGFEYKHCPDCHNLFRKYNEYNVFGKMIRKCFRENTFYKRTLTPQDEKELVTTMKFVRETLSGMNLNALAGTTEV